MIAADTNIIVRLLTADEPRQTEQARRLFETETVFLPKTVLLEAEWVLRRLYRLERLPIIRAFESLLSLPNVRCEDEPAVRQALEWNRANLDFADALHLASGRTAERFVTFDLGLIKGATTAGIAVSEP
ncbi:type II toxin-antitoxin system VapC family toxin [Rhodopila globiformis]|uniref:type II toxin-antitoxin system VapC family toxin n=1 Tax=Rhodopila globiformis TaxID=1071 RepID=UPI00195D2362|nr:type II toxin-antitoxin system VapC family toxin [Rhodopila globiformis]